MSDLEKRISAALSGDSLTSVELSALCNETEMAIDEARVAAEREREAAFDPAQRPDPQAARQAMEDATFRANRLQTLLPRLSQRCSELQIAEERAVFEEKYTAVKGRRDHAVDHLIESFPHLLNDLGSLISQMIKIDAECAEVNALAASLPNEGRRLRGVELTARGLRKFTAGTPSFFDARDPRFGLRLPDLADSTKFVWPPAQPPLAAQFASAMIMPSDPQRYSNEWWKSRDEDSRRAAERDRERAAQAAKEEAQKRQEFYLNMAAGSR